jgi:glycosyltransferase involved in cell wall biosynthesis
VAARLKRMAPQIDLVHAWPRAARRTLLTARELGIPTFLERPNAHTRYLFTTVQAECDRLGVVLPPGAEGRWDTGVLRLEEEEYELADYLLCPSDFVVRTFLEQGVPPDKLVRHHYGFDHHRWHPEAEGDSDGRPFTMLFAGYGAVRKGLHFALEAWRDTPASRGGRFLVAGDLHPSYREVLEPLLALPGVEVLGHRSDLPELMRSSDVFVLPSLEEGSPLVCLEAMASGAVPAVSEAAAGECRHLEQGLVHPIADVATLTDHITRLCRDRDLRRALRAASIEHTLGLTWDQAGRSLLDAYCRHDLPSRVPPSGGEAGRSAGVG